MKVTGSVPVKPRCSTSSRLDLLSTRWISRTSTKTEISTLPRCSSSAMILSSKDSSSEPRTWPPFPSDQATSPLPPPTTLYLTHSRTWLPFLSPPVSLSPKLKSLRPPLDLLQKLLPLLPKLNQQRLKKNPSPLKKKRLTLIWETCSVANTERELCNTAVGVFSN